MSRSFIVSCTIVAAAAAVSAQEIATSVKPATQQKETPSPAATPSPGDQKTQVGNFEVFLQGAMTSAIDRFGQWVQVQAAPNIVHVGWASRPVFQGFPTPEGLTFTVQHGRIIGEEMVLVALQQPRPQPQPGTTAVAAQGGLVQPDPMVATSPVAGTAAAPPAEGCAKPNGVMNPDQKISECVQESLINAMLDSSFMLPLKKGQWLIVVDAPMEQSFGPASRKLILSIKAEDLQAYHEHKITRDEAIARIDQKRF